MPKKANSNNTKTGAKSKDKKNKKVNESNIKLHKKFCIETIQDTIPIHCVHDKYNLIESFPGNFSRMYALSNINYQTASQEEQEIYLTDWRTILNIVGNNQEFSVSIYNREINMQQFCEQKMLKETGDDLDYLRRQMNKINIDRIKESRNGIQSTEYITVSVRTNDVETAYNVFRRLDQELNNNLSNLKSSATPVPIEYRLEMLHDIYNPDSIGEFLKKSTVIDDEGVRREINSFSFDNIRRMGIEVQDIIAPSYMKFERDKIRLGNAYARVVKVGELSSMLSDNFLTSFAKMQFDLLVTFTAHPINSKETSELLKSNINLAREEIIQQKKKLRKEEIPEDMVNPDLLDKEAAAMELRNNVNKDDEHLFETTCSVIIFAPTKEKLEEYTATVVSEFKKFSIEIDMLHELQEEGFNTTLPLCHNEIFKKRTLKSSSAALFMPFSNLDINDPTGIPYNINDITHNLIFYDRLRNANFNGFVLGSSGSGKSFAVKTEAFYVKLGRLGSTFIIDPEGEYSYITNKLKGQVIKLMPGSPYHINPLDLPSNYEMDTDNGTGNPILEKSSFITQLFESMIGKAWGMDSIQKTIIDEVLRTLYSPFTDEAGNLICKVPREKTPTLTDMLHMFERRNEAEARELIYTLRRFAGKGSYNIFSYRTNVDLDNDIVCFDISQVGEELKLMAMNIIQDALWSKMVENKKLGKNTFFYVDECHLFFQPGNESAAAFLVSLWKRARKYGGVPTGITQNVKDLLDHPLGNKLLSECSYVQIFKQQDKESRDRIKETYNLSDIQMKYITNSTIGKGLFYTGVNAVPFYSRFPEDNDIYPILMSDMKKLAKIEAEKKKKLAEEKRLQKQKMYAEEFR